MMKTLVAAAFLASSAVAYGQADRPATRKSDTAKRDTVASSHSPRD
jgi:hypothetical protein